MAIPLLISPSVPEDTTKESVRIDNHDIESHMGMGCGRLLYCTVMHGVSVSPQVLRTSYEEIVDEYKMDRHLRSDSVLLAFGEIPAVRGLALQSRHAQRRDTVSAHP